MESPVPDSSEVLKGHLHSRIKQICPSSNVCAEIISDLVNKFNNKEIVQLLADPEAFQKAVEGTDGYASEKRKVGEMVYTRVAKIVSSYPEKITGMMLELDLNTLNQILNDDAMLGKAVDKCKSTYYSHLQISKSVTPEHLQLSDYIKKVHKELRILSERIGSSEAWELHCKQECTLKSYAESMHELATTFWDQNNKADSSSCRIQWVVQQCCKYFIDGGWEVEAQREMELIKKHFSEKPIFSTSILKKFSDNPRDKINLLDVGSCYNPFKSHSIFEVTAIDLYPATDDVYKCDFIKVSVSKQLLIDGNKLISMPKESFHVVVFSLLLEYFPDPAQRYLCCEKAYNLLLPEGVLFILSPDSKHPTANSRLMKEWRISLASLGFFKIQYQKLKHLHCLMMRKNVAKELPVRWFNMKNTSNAAPQSMLAIPQDYS